VAESLSVDSVLKPCKLMALPFLGRVFLPPFSLKSRLPITTCCSAAVPVEKAVNRAERKGATGKPAAPGRSLRQAQDGCGYSGFTGPVAQSPSSSVARNRQVGVFDQFVHKK
jgi:hypothetical protein